MIVTKAKWKSLVVSRCPPDIGRRYRDQAIEYFYEEVEGERPNYQIDAKVRECLRLAGFLQDQQTSSPTTAEKALLDCRPGALAEWAGIKESLRPMIESLRKDLFRRTGPPFQGRYVAGVRWLRGKARKQDAPSATDREAARRLIERARTLLRTPVGPLAYGLACFQDDYPSTRIDYLPVFDDSPLTSFANTIHRIVRQTGMNAAMVIDHVLTGFPLVPPLVRLESHQHFGGQTALTLHLPSAQTALGLKADDLRRMIRGHLGLKKARSLSDRDRKFYEDCVRDGRPPQRDTEGFWQGIAERHGLGSRRAAKNKFRRLTERLGRVADA